MNGHIATILFAYLLDLIFGDPQWKWHPVRLLGRFIEVLEKKFNVAAANKRFSGAVFLIIVIAVTSLFVWAVLDIAGFIHPVLHFAVSTVLIYFALSIKSLAVEAKKVYKAIKNKNIHEARTGISMIAGRDTQKLDEPAIIRATVETVAESTMDGIIAPLFYAFLGGPVLVWTYKAINTLDSMVGYRNERFIKFGWASAKIDALVNFIPSKITYLFLSISALFYGRDFLNSFRWGFRYFLKGLEFNGIVTEAAMAGALKVQLGGLNFYNSVPVTKPLIGEAEHTLEIRHIGESIRLAYLCSFLFLLTGTFFYFVGRR